MRAREPGRCVRGTGFVHGLTLYFYILHSAFRKKTSWSQLTDSEWGWGGVGCGGEGRVGKEGCCTHAIQPVAWTPAQNVKAIAIQVKGDFFFLSFFFTY